MEDFDLIVIGAGPGGYVAAIRAAQLGMKVACIEKEPSLGGTCLNIGCIPSKALLHVAKVIDDAHAMKDHGIDFGTPRIDPIRLSAWKNSVVGKLTNGLKSLAKQRKVECLTGKGTFLDSHHLQIESKSGTTTVRFENAIIAAGSEPVKLPFHSFQMIPGSWIPREH